MTLFRDHSNFTPERLAQMKQIFIENLPPGKGELTLTEFKKILPDKNVSYECMLHSVSFLRVPRYKAH